MKKGSLAAGERASLSHKVSRLLSGIAGRHQPADASTRQEVMSGQDPGRLEGGPPQGSGRESPVSAQPGRWKRFSDVIFTAQATVATITGVVLLAAGLVTGLHLNSAKPSAPTALITSPTSRVVDPKIVVSGDVHDLPQDKELLFDIQDLSNNRHNPDSQQCSVTGTTFNCGEVYIGGAQQRNHLFELELWIVGVAQIQAIDSYNSTASKRGYPGMAEPPDGTLVAAWDRVLRR
jgi:hypothetical protein